MTENSAEGKQSKLTFQLFIEGMAHAGVKGPHCRQDVQCVMIPAGTTHQSPFHPLRQLEGGKGVGKTLSARIEGWICRSDEKCFKPLADRFPDLLPPVPHLSSSPPSCWSWLRPTPLAILPLPQTWLRFTPPTLLPLIWLRSPFPPTP